MKTFKGFFAFWLVILIGLMPHLAAASGERATCPEAPQNLEAGSFPGRQIRLQWQAAPQGETGFQVERAAGPFTPTSFTLITTLPAGAQNYTDTPPVLGETYWYRVRAFNSGCFSPYSNPSYNATFDTAPNLDEQYLLVLINTARADPAAFGFPEIQPMPPLAYNPLLNYAARSHSQAILNSGFQFGHCDPIGRCPTERARSVGYPGGVAENLVQGMTGTEWVESSNRAFLDSKGHRENMLNPAFNEAGLGHSYDLSKGGGSYWKGQYTETFSSRPEVVIPSLPSGAVIPYTGNADTLFTFIANYYNPRGDAPAQALVYIDGQPHPMSLSTGSAANGSYRFTSTLPTSNHEHYFYFTFPGGSARLPQQGGYNYPRMAGPQMPGVFLPILQQNTR